MFHNLLSSLQSSELKICGCARVQLAKIQKHFRLDAHENCGLLQFLIFGWRFHTVVSQVSFVIVERAQLENDLVVAEEAVLRKNQVRTFALFVEDSDTTFSDEVDFSERFVYFLNDRVFGSYSC